MVEKTLNEEKLRKLGSLLAAIKKDVVTPRHISEFVADFLDEIRKQKDFFNQLTEEKIALTDQIVSELKNKLEDIKDSINDELETREGFLSEIISDSVFTVKEESKKELDSAKNNLEAISEELKKSLKDARSLISKLESVEIHHGKDADENAMVEKILAEIKLPENKDIVLDTGEDIVDKINSLSLTEENKIDASHIKNLPETKVVGGGSTARNLYQLGDVSISSPLDGESLVYDSATNTWKNESGAGMSNPMTAIGDIIVGGTAGAATSLPVGTNGEVLTLVAGTPSWEASSSFTTEEAQDAVGAMADSESLVYADATPLLSVKVQQSITKDASGLKLSGDLTSPGNNQVYGTDASGVKGWKADPSGGTGFSKDTIGVTVDGGGSVITTGSKGYKVIQEACTITGWTILGKESGSVVVDIKKSTYAGFPTTSTITGTEKPTLSSAQKNQDLTLTTWTTSLAEGDILEFVVDSASTCTRFNLFINIEK